MISYDEISKIQPCSEQQWVNNVEMSRSQFVIGEEFDKIIVVKFENSFGMKMMVPIWRSTAILNLEVLSFIYWILFTVQM